MKGIDRFKKILQQRGLKYALSAIGVGVIFLGVNMKFSSKEQRKKAEVVETKIESATENMDNITRWTEQAAAERQAVQKELDEAKNDLAKAKKELASIKQGMVSRDSKMAEQFKVFQDDITSSVQDSLQKGLESNKKLVEDAKPKKGCKIIESNAEFRDVGVATATLNTSANQRNYLPKKKSLGFGIVALNLVDNQNNSIGAGDIIKAKLLSGVVVSTATNSSKHPRPVVMELLDGVDSPAKWFFSKQKKCLLIGAAYGSISDERAYVRLETLRCINRETSKSVETTVSGFVSDESGRVGIRGTVVTRDRQFLMNSVIGGTLAGMSNAFNQLSSPVNSYNPLTGNVNQNNSTKSLLRQAGSQGIGSALDRYAKYQIDRAQMLEPVIQISAGRHVDIVFTQGVSLGTLGRPLNIRQNNTSENVSSASLQNNTTLSDIPGLNNTNPRGQELASEFAAEARGY